MMVGPDVEATALVRHCSRLFVTGANLSVPVVSVVLRKSYGLGAQAMMGGSTKAPLACVAWPTGEFGGMGLEGAVQLGYRKELEACVDDAARSALFDELVARLYEHGKALSIAEYFEIDDVIDPADTRRWITALLESAPARDAAPVRSHVDTGERWSRVRLGRPVWGEGCGVVSGEVERSRRAREVESGPARPARRNHGSQSPSSWSKT